VGACSKWTKENNPLELSKNDRRKIENGKEKENP
jgi:hypothetical protein